jgi:hypothetical protein
MSARAERRRAEREARRGISLADRAAYELITAIDAALAQQRYFETHGLKPGDVPGGVFSEDGEPLTERLPGTKPAGLVIIVTRKAALGPAVWLYTTREAALDILTRPAMATFNAAKAGHTISPIMWEATMRNTMARMNAQSRDVAARRYAADRANG